MGVYRPQRESADVPADAPRLSSAPGWRAGGTHCRPVSDEPTWP